MTIDLKELAVDRRGSSSPRIRNRRHLLTRYVLPLGLVSGFLSLVAWASRDVVFPPKSVTVVPVFSETAAVRQEGTPLFKAAGWIEPRPTPVRVAALAPGVVEKLLVVEDQLVKTGDPIAVLVSDDAEFVHQRALADLELRQAEVDEANAAQAAAETRFKQPVHLKAVLSEAEASLARIETQLKNLPFEIRRAEADHMAMQKDYDAKTAVLGVVASVQIDIAKSKVASTKALVDELRVRSESLEQVKAALVNRRDALKTQLDLRADETKDKDEAKARVRAALARVALARVVVAEAKLRLDRMTVVSPIDGRVYRLIAHPGARIGGGMTQMTGYDGSTVVTMYRPDMLQLRVDVRFEDILKVSVKQTVEIDNPAIASPITGKVLFVSSEADIQKNMLQVKVEIPNPPAVFKPEMLVDVTFLSPKSNDKSQVTLATRIYVPERYIQESDGGYFVWLADQSDGIARKTIVEIGVESSGRVEITSGLTISSWLISSGSDGLKNGDRINVMGEG